MVTIKDVARAAGVSTATVSRVLNAREVDQQLAERVRAAVDELGYRPNLVARGLRTQETSLVALVISDIENPFFTSMARGVEDVASAAGYSVVLCNTDEDLVKEARYIDVLAAQRIGGTIIAAASERDTDVSPLLQRSVKIVAFDRRLAAPVDTVLVDNIDGARVATAHLLGNRFRRVGCITGPRSTTTAIERLRGYRAALRAAGISRHPALEVFADYKEDGGHAAARAMLTGPRPPDALFVGNNRMTVGALAAIRELGLAVPGDVGVVGFDDLPWAELMVPTLTTVAQPAYEMGTVAAGMLVERLKGAPGPQQVRVLKPTLKVRGSSAGPRRVPADERHANARARAVD